MSKAAKLSIYVLIVVVLGILGVTTFIYLDKVRLEKEKTALQKQVDEFQTRERNQLLENKTLQDKIAAAEAAKKEAEEKLGGLDTNLSSLNDKIKKLGDESESWKKQVESLRAERDSLVAKLQEKPKETVVYKYVDRQSGKEMTPEEAQRAQTEQPVKTAATDTYVPKIGDENDAEWAKVLKDKAALEVELDALRRETADHALQVEELKKENSELQLSLSKIKDEKSAIEREIKYGKDLADNLSLELARAKNDKKFNTDRMEKLTGENAQLHEQLKELMATKVALEKSIVLLQEDKKEMERKMVQTENVLQNRIDQIWEIKQNLKNFKTPETASTKEVELSPIVVSSQEQAIGRMQLPPAETEVPGLDASIVSVNNDNNFVIINAGEARGIQIGDRFSVYRGTDYIGGLEIIQVRKDIAAADIKEQSSEFQVGDLVR